VVQLLVPARARQLVAGGGRPGGCRRAVARSIRKGAASPTDCSSFTQVNFFLAMLLS
jgi:hypothetical protein